MEKLRFITDLSRSPELMQELSAAGTTHKLRRGEVLLNEHSFVASIPIVLSGRLNVYQSDEEEAREMLLYYLQPGETCIMSVLGGLFNEASKVRVVCEADCEVLMVPVTRMGALLQDHPAWTNYIFRIYHQRFEELLDVLGAVTFRKMDQRLLQHLRRMSTATGSPVLHVTHEQLAGELGTARVVVSRLLKQMEQQGLVELGRNQVRLRN
jgi:CRP/FNR family transcriptional regulator